MRKSIFTICVCILALVAFHSVSYAAFNFGDLFSSNKEKNVALKDEKPKDGNGHFRNGEFDDKKMIIGRIKSISSDNVTIEVATRKNRDEKIEKPEKSDDEKGKREKFNIENMFTFSGETKTINIKSADLGKKNVKNDDATEEKLEKLTYADYKSGDIVRITLKEDAENEAVRMREANRGFDPSEIEKRGSYEGGYKGTFTGKTKKEKETSAE